MPHPPDDALVDLILQLSLARDLEQIMSIVRSKTRRLTGADGVTFVLRDNDKCHYVDEEAISPLWKGQRFPMERCISGWSMLNRLPVLIEDIFADERIPHDAYRATFVKSLIMVPVRRDDPVAAIGAYWADTNRPTLQVVETMQIIANSAAVAMTNVSLIQSLKTARDEAERANAAKTRFLSNIGHELRTPLNAIIGFAEMMQIGPLPPDRQVEYTDYILGSGRQLLEMVSDLLDVASLAEGSYRVERSENDLGEMLFSICQSFAGTARLGGVKLVQNLPDGPVPGLFDRRAIRQCLFNLISNAIKFTPRGGRVTVTLRGDDAQAQVIVTDTGIGMNEMDLRRSTELFVQPARERGQYHQGMGVGLSLSQSLLKLHNGRLSISSGEQDGTTVTMTLPLFPVLAEAPKEAPKPTVVKAPRMA